MEKEVENVLTGADEILDAEQAARFTHYKLSWLYQLAHKRVIPHYKRGSRIFFLRSELASWLLQNRRRTQDELQAEAERRAR